MRSGHSHALRGWRRTLTAAFAAAGALSLILAPTWPGAAAPIDSLNETAAVPAIPLPSLAPLVNRVLPAVVNVSVRLQQETAKGSSSAPAIPGNTPFDEFLRRFFEQQFGQNSPLQPFEGQNETMMALGSGFIVDPSGYIVTNNHVVDHAKKVTVILQDHSRHTAKVIGRDSKSDLALIKIKTDKPLPYVTFGDSKTAEVGDWIVAVGNPFGLGGTVTAGIISALGRNIDNGSFEDFLQIDAPINRGNSGGPTFNMKGQVIGINTAIYSPSGGSVGIGFDIPSNIAKKVVAELKKSGHATWGWLGVAIQSLTPSIAKSLGLPDPEHAAGALVASVVLNSPAAKAGIEQGDVITSANGHKIETVRDLPRIVSTAPIGSRLVLGVLRDGKERTIEASIGGMPKQKQLAETEESAKPPPKAGEASALGMQLKKLDPQMRDSLKLPSGTNGVVIGSIAEDSPVRGSGLQPGDVIVSINQKPVSSPQQAAAALKRAAASGNILLLLDRNGVTEFLGMTIGKRSASGNAG
jgi:serine protease Do